VGNSQKDRDQLLEAAMVFGLDITEHLEQEDEVQAEEACEVWPQNWDALTLFLACQGQRELVIGGMGGACYAETRSVNVHQELVWLGFPKKRHAELVQQFRQIEREALELINTRLNESR
jgi:hypothetical protein